MPKIVQGAGAPVRRLLLSVLAATLGALAFTTAPALAEFHHGFTSSFGTKGSAPGQLNEPSGVAVNDSSVGSGEGDVYVVDKGNNRVEVFEADGTYLSEFAPPGGFHEPETIAVDNSGSALDPSKEDVYVTDKGGKVIDKFSPDGAYLGQLANGSGVPFGVAVDSSGVVWVYQSSGEIESYSDALANELLSSIAGPSRPEPGGFAVDSEDNFYPVWESYCCYKAIAKLNSAGDMLSEDIGEGNLFENTTGVAVNLTSDEIFIDNSTKIDAFSTTGSASTLIETFGSGHLVSGAGVAVSSVTGTVYAPDAVEDAVDVFTVGEAPAEAPKTATPPSEITATSAKLHGELNPGGATGELEYLFDFNTGGSCRGGKSTPVPAGEKSEAKEAAVEAEATGLEPNAQYTYCLVAANPFGDTQGNEATFETSAAPPTIEGESTPAAKAIEATLEATINPNNQATAYSFEYASSEAAIGTPGATRVAGAPPAPALNGFGGQTVSVSTGAVLAQATTYYYRVIAENAQSEAEGKPATGKVERFKTALLPEVPEAPTVQLVGATRATVHGILNPSAESPPGTYEFLYKASTSNECEGESRAPAAGIALGFDREEVTETLTALTPDTEYAVCLLARNGVGDEVVGPPVTFTTILPLETPEAKPANPVAATTATLIGVLNPGAVGNPGSYEFRYRQSAGECQGGNPGEEQATTPTMASGNREEAAEARVTGLAPGRPYTFCLIVYNEAREAAVSAPVTFTTLGQPPTIEAKSESSSEVTLTGATVSALVDPGGLASTYRVEYGTSAAYGSSTPETNLPGATSDVPVSILLSSLEPGTLYHFRFVVSNALGTVSDAEDATFTTKAPAPTPEHSACPNEASRQGPSALLPDCRAYEQVTPVDKGGAEDMFPLYAGVGGASSPSRGFPSEDGDHFAFITGAQLGEEGGGGEAAYVFSRGADGWTTTPLADKAVGVQSLTFELFNSDMSEIGISADTGSYAGEESKTRPKLYLIGPPGGPYTTLSSVATSPGGIEGASALEGGSADMSHVMLMSDDEHLENQQLVSGPPAGQDEGYVYDLYEWVDGKFSLVNAKPDGSLLSPCGAFIAGASGNYGGGYGGETLHAVSSDGSKVFFVSPDPGEGAGEGPGCWGENGGGELVNPPQLYMRLDGTSTVNVSAPAPDAPEQTLYPAVYVGASANGEKVFFLSRGALTADAPRTHDLELYEYDTQTSTLTRVSRGDSGTAEGNVFQVPEVSSDGSSVYFTSFSQLAPGAPEVGSGQVNIYRYDTDTGVTTYVAMVSENDYSSDATGHWYVRFEYAPAHDVALTDTANWYTTGNGQYLAFPSEPAGQIDLYSAASNKLVCASCDPNGSGGGGAQFARSTDPFVEDTNSPRGISENGKYVFFDSFNALVPGAIPGVLKVYEWDEGTIKPISAPADPSPSFYLGASASGGDVFFGTHSQLVPQDTDQSGDIYDARIDGGFEGIAPPACTGSGCQGVPGAAPIFATPSSVTYAGVGNFEGEQAQSTKTVTKKTTRCKKGFTKSKGRCVKDRKRPKKAKKSAHADRRASR